MEAFEVLMAQVSPLLEEQYTGFLLDDLHKDICMEILALEPPNCHCLGSVACLIECKLDRSGWRASTPQR